jgi:hypothetical protein
MMMTVPILLSKSWHTVTLKQLQSSACFDSYKILLYRWKLAIWSLYSRKLSTCMFIHAFQLHVHAFEALMSLYRS